VLQDVLPWGLSFLNPSAFKNFITFSNVSHPGMAIAMSKSLVQLIGFVQLN